MISILAFHHVELHVTSVQKSHALLGHTASKVVGLKDGLHDTSVLISWITLSQSIILSFKYIHAKFVLLPVKSPLTFPVKIISHLSPGLIVIHP